MLFYVLLFRSCCLTVEAQLASTSTPVPPLQWINLTSLLQGSSRPPPLKGAVIGYDETRRSIIIFGGESESGFPQSQTYLLDLQTLSWTVPAPPPNLQQVPPARSAAISGMDLAASYREGFVVIGGKGVDGSPLSDIWEFDFNNQFWSVVNTSGGPSPRWGASGGIDNRTPTISDPRLSGPNNTFYLAGGLDGANLFPLSDVWRLNISGTLSSNLPGSVIGSWDRRQIGNVPSRYHEAGTVILQTIISAGGCNNASDSLTDNTCASQDLEIIDYNRQVTTLPGPCPAPRFSPALTPNLNTFSSSFASQVFLLGGTFNHTHWDDGNGSMRGEVAVLDTDTGTWSRVIPAGDPGTTGSPAFPAPKDGLAAISFPSSLVGDSRNLSADTLIFGGRDAAGIYSSEVWLLRAYFGSVTQLTPTWSGFGNGRLQTGINADGSGVRNDFLSSCATRLVARSPSPSSIGSSSPSGFPLVTNNQSPRRSLPHQILSPLSLAIILPLILISRHLPLSFSWGGRPQDRRTLIVLLAVFATYVLGIAGFALSFVASKNSTSTSTPVVQKLSSRSTGAFMTLHGKEGLIFFICLYCVFPVLLVGLCFFKTLSNSLSGNAQDSGATGTKSMNGAEKVTSVKNAITSPPRSLHSRSNTSLVQPRRRAQSWGPSIFFRKSSEAMSSDSESVLSNPRVRHFEVLNRTSRSRPTSESNNTRASVPPTSFFHFRDLGDVDWLTRRRSLNAVGELDYAITQAQNARAREVARASFSPRATPPDKQRDHAPLRSLYIIVQVALHMSVAGTIVITLVALWTNGSRPAFAVFLSWTALFYVAVLASIYHKQRSKTRAQVTAGMNSWPSGHAVYIRQPPYHLSTPHDNLGPTDARSAETSGEDDDLDDNTRQRMMEEEMDRREVSVVTIPRRKLLVTNPS